MRTSNTVKISSLACAVIAALACGQAMASGFQIREDSIDAMSRSHAGSASDWGDAAVVVNNPAAMSLFDKTTVQTDLTAIDLHGTFTGGGHDAAGQPLSGGDGGDAGDTTPVPAFHAILPLGNGFTMGASLTSPFGLKTQYDPGWVGRYQALKSELKTYDFTLSGAYKFNDMFSLGASVIYQHADAELSNAIDFGAIMAGPPFNLAPPNGPFLPQAADGTGDVKGSDSSFGWDVGLLFRPTPDTNIGLNYRSKIDHTINGHVNFNVPSSVQAIFGLAGVTGFQDSAATAAISTPSVFTLSASQRFGGDFTLSADVERTNWNEFKNLEVDFANPETPPDIETFNWKSSTEVAVGFDWKFEPTWVLRAGIARDETPTNDQTRDPRLPDNNRTLYSVGLGWMPTENITWNIGYSRISIDTPNVNDVSATGSTLVGKYDADANLFGVSAMFSF